MKIVYFLILVLACYGAYLSFIRGEYGGSESDKSAGKAILACSGLLFAVAQVAHLAMR